MSARSIGVGCVAALFALTITLSPFVGKDNTSENAELQVAEIDPRWDGVWEHQTPDPVHHLVQESPTPSSRITNFVSDNRSPAPEAILAADATLPELPFLRTETYQHSASIRDIDVDAQSRFLVTGSEDKTARVWAIPMNEGEAFKLLRVLRPPIDNRQDGDIEAVAISPDGEFIAIAGWTGWNWDNNASIYLFHRASGQLVRRLDGLPMLVSSLRFSQDGNFLAAGLQLSHGIRVWRTRDWRAVSVEQGTDYGGHVLSLSFASDGRLATVSFDGFVRVYTPDFKLANKTMALSGQRLATVAFSPDGRKMAVSALATPQIAVLSSNSLKEIYRPATGDIYQSSDFALSQVAWSKDGTILYAAGIAQKPFAANNYTNRFIRRYTDEGRGAFTDISVSWNTVMELRSTDRGLFFGAADPAFGLVNDEGVVTAFLGDNKIDFRASHYQQINNLKSLRVSQDGKSVSTPFWNGGAPAWRFDAGNRTVFSFNGEDVALNYPRLGAGAMRVTDWPGTAPRLNGRPLTLERYENARSIAVAPSGSKMLVGADWRIRLYDLNGSTLWEQPGPGVAWKINISENERFAIAAYGDGTVRWYDLRDGQELLALYVTNEPGNTRWLAWTPSGYYDASPGAEDLIGWHINQAKDKEALFFSASRFRDLYYRPGIANEVLTTLDVAPPPTREALLAAAPPIVKILGQETLVNGDVVVRYEARTIFGDPVDLEVFVDDAKLDLSGSRYASSETLTIPRGACADTLALVARDASGRRSDAEIFSASRSVSLSVCETGRPPKPNLRALIIGISDYQNDEIDLNFAHQDALDFAKLLKAQQGGAYEKVEVDILVEGAATKAAIEAALSNLQDDDTVTSNDATIIFFAGHGVKRERSTGNTLYLLSHEANLGSLSGTAVSQTRLIEAVAERPGRKFVFLDACFSSFGEETGLGLFDMQGMANTLGGGDIRAEVFSSATGAQLSWEHADWSNGAFTEALLEAISGDADYTGDNQVTNDELNLYLKGRVRTLVNDKYGLTQTPTYTTAGGVEFPLAAVNE